MSTTSTPVIRRTLPAAIAARAVLAAALAGVVIFSQDHGQAQSVTAVDRDPSFGLVVLGVYLIGQAVVLAGFHRSLAVGGPGRVLVLARAAVSAACGTAALLSTSAGLGALRPIEAVAFLAVGALEVVGGLRRDERPALAGDAVVVGGLQVLVGLMVVILNPDTVFSVGVLAAWGGLVAVYLGISAVNTGRKGTRP